MTEFSAKDKRFDLEERTFQFAKSVLLNEAIELKKIFASILIKTGN